MNVLKRLLIVLFFVGGAGYAQDVHFTQQFDNDIYLNPAQSGLGDKANRLVLQYRDQWRSVPVPFASAFASYDRRIFRNASNLFGAGGQLLFDRSGDGHLSTIRASIAPAYTRFLKEDRVSLSVGFQVGIVHRFIDMDRLIFESQYDGTNINDNSGEALSGSVTRPDLGAGLQIAGAIGEKRHTVTGGFSIYNLTTPDVSFVQNATDERPIRYNVYASSEVFVGNGWSINPVFQFQRQEAQNNILPILYAKRYFPNEQRHLALSFGGGYRVSDAAQMYVAMEVGDFKLGLTYDLNTSGFTDATNTVGAGEILLKYQWERPKEKEVIEVYVDTMMVDTTEEIEELVEEPDTEEEVVVVESPEEVIPAPEVTPGPAPKPEPKPDLIEQINDGMAIRLYFPNDYPDPRSTRPTTNSAYIQTFREYMRLSVEYYIEGGEEGNMVGFVEDHVVAEWHRYQELMKEVRGLLRKGKKVTITLRGYTSPLATGEYNLNLSKRRIESVRRQIALYEGAEQWVEDGMLVIEEAPYGETEADPTVSDDRSNKKASVYSDKAAFERRVEIEKVTVE